MYLINYLKIGFGLFLSYLIVYFFSGVVFLGNTPALRPHPELYLANKIQTQTNNLLAGLNFGQKNKSNITKENFNQYISTETAKGLKLVAPGTYASEKEVIVDTTNMMNKQTVQMKDGSVKEIYVQAGRRVPTADELEATLKRINALR